MAVQSSTKKVKASQIYLKGKNNKRLQLALTGTCPMHLALGQSHAGALSTACSLTVPLVDTASEDTHRPQNHRAGIIKAP